MQEIESAMEEAIDESQGDGIEPDVEDKMNQVLKHSNEVKRRLATEIRMANMRARK